MQTLHGPRKALKVEVCQAPVAGHQAFAQVLAIPRFGKLLITRIDLSYICRSLRRVKLASFHPSANMIVEMRQCIFCKRGPARHNPRFQYLHSNQPCHYSIHSFIIHSRIYLFIHLLFYEAKTFVQS